MYLGREALELLLNGSPKGKRSNTYKLATSFIEGIREKQEVVVEELFVNELELKPCLGCFSCWNKTPGKCLINFYGDIYSLVSKMVSGKGCQGTIILQPEVYI